MSQTGEKPWCVTAYEWCLNTKGELIHWPRNGAWHEQSQWELKAIRNAWYVNRLYGHNKKKWGQADSAFIVWLMNEDKEPIGAFDIRSFIGMSDEDTLLDCQS